MKSKIFITYSEIILQNQFNLVLDVTPFSGNIATYNTLPEIASNYFVQETILTQLLYMLPISFYHGDGLFLQLKINIFLKILKKSYLCLVFAICSYTMPALVIL